MSGSNAGDPEDLRLAADRIDSTREEVDRYRNQIDHLIEQLGGDWTGTDSRAFREMRERWADSVEHLTGVLDDLADRMRRTADTRTATDERQDESAAHIEDALNPPLERGT